MITWNTVRSKITALLLTVFFVQSHLAQDLVLPDSCQLIAQLFTVADSIYELQNHQALNIQILEKIGRISEKCLDYENQALAITKLSVIHRDENNFHRYSSYIDSALVVAKARLDSLHFLFPYLYSELTDINRTKRLYRASNEAAIKGIHHSEDQNSDLAVYLTNKLAENYISLGNYAKAKFYLGAAQDIIKNFDINGYYEFNIYLNTAFCNKRLKSYEQAIKYYNKAEMILISRNRVSEQIDLIYLWLAYAKFLIELDQEEKGKKYVTKVIDSQFKLDGYANAELSYILALLEESKPKSNQDSIFKQLEKAINFYDKTQATNFNYSVKQALTCEKKGDIYSESGLYTNAIDAYKQGIYCISKSLAIDSLQFMQNKDHVIRLLTKIQYVHYKENNFTQADSIEEKILILTRYLSVQNSTASIKKFWANENQVLIEKLIEQSYSRKRYDQIFRLIEENKSNILLKDINADISSDLINIPTKTIQQGKKLESELLYKQNQALLNKKTESSPTIEQLDLLKDIRLLQIELDAYKNKLEEDFPEYYKLNYKILDINIKTHQEGLDSQTLMIEYFIGENHSYVAFISRNDLTVKRISNSKILKAEALKYYDLLSSATGGRKLNAYSRSLFKNLGLSFIEEQPSSFEKLIIIADDFLNNIPFETLSQKNGTYLIESFTINYQYSAKLGVMLKTRIGKKKQMDFVGYAFNGSNSSVSGNRSCIDLRNSKLKCAQKEIDGIQISLHNKELSLAFDMNSVLENAQSTKILHLATHACLDNTDADLSRIYFDKNYLTNKDLLLANIPVDMVVLSACETGFGEIIKGEGSMSLSKGFFHAGAKSTVVSLWPVDDCSTALLMKHFYDFLQKGYTKDSALRLAKLAYRKYANPEKLAPYFWAGFIVLGNCDALWPANADLSTLYFSVAFFIIGCIVLMYWKRKE